MKNYFLFLLSFLMISINAKSLTSTSDPIVNIENVFANKFYITVGNGSIKYVSESYISKEWESLLEKQGISTKLDKFEILTSENSETSEKFYFLKAISTKDKITTGAFFQVTEKGMRLLEKKCTCVGCSSGCNLTTFGSNCSCSNCGLSGPQDCKKTEEIVIKDVF